MWPTIGIAGAVIGAGLIAVLVLRPIVMRSVEARRRKQARRMFALRREWLEAEFLSLASKSGKPRGLAWVNCVFENHETLARDRKTGELKAFVGVTISFDAIEGGGMEHVEAVGNLRAATAVFSYLNDRWTTDGVALFNVNPTEAIKRFEHEVELVD